MRSLLAYLIFRTKGHRLFNPYRYPEIDNDRVRRCIHNEHCPDCLSFRFHNITKRDYSTVITETVECTKCKSKFAIEYWDANKTLARRL